MDTALQWLEHHIHGEWSVVTDAPILFGMACLFAAAIIFTGLRLHFGGRLESKDERIAALEATIAQKQSLLDEYKDRLNGATPLEVQKKIAALEERLAAIDRRVNRPKRRLSQDQSDGIYALIKEAMSVGELSQPYHVTVSSSSDTDSQRYSAQISKCLARAGISTGGMLGSGRHDEGEYGITFYCPDFEADRRFHRLSKIFEAVGLPISRKIDENNRNSTYIFVTPEED